MEIWLPIINIAGFIVLIATQYRKGKTEGTNELIQLLQSRDNAQKELIVDYQKKFESIQAELGQLRGQLIEKDKKIDEYLLIFQGRNPQLTEFMRLLTEANVKNAEIVKGSQAHMKATSETLKEIHNFMKQLNSKAQTNQSRNEKIDSATSKEEGHVLRQKD